MKTPKTERNKSANDSEITDNSTVESKEKKGTGRRLLDAILSKNSNRKLNPGRRIAYSDRRSGIVRRSGSDRRINTDHGYDGPTSRFTIDRRLNLKDRRDKS